MLLIIYVFVYLCITTESFTLREFIVVDCFVRLTGKNTFRVL